MTLTKGKFLGQFTCSTHLGGLLNIELASQAGREKWAEGDLEVQSSNRPRLHSTPTHAPASEWTLGALQLSTSCDSSKGRNKETCLSLAEQAAIPVSS